MENLNIQNIVNQILNLSIDMQIQIIDKLQKNIILQTNNCNYKWNNDITKLQQIELERRLKNIENGKTISFSWEEIEKDLDEIIEKDKTITV
jgi:putative addiction module component (TIGR02574 family)